MDVYPVREHYSHHSHAMVSPSSQPPLPPSTANLRQWKGWVMGTSFPRGSHHLHPHQQGGKIPVALPLYQHLLWLVSIFSHSTGCAVIFSMAPADVLDSDWFLGAYYVLERADLHNEEDDHWAIRGQGRGSGC